MLLGALLLFSVLLKIPGSASKPEGDKGEIASRIAGFLEDNGFQAAQMASDEDMFIVSARAGDCELSIASLSLQGWHRHVIRKLGAADSKLLFLFEGKLYTDQPLLLTRTYDYWSRLVRFAGGTPPLQPLYGIIGSPECSLDCIKWRDLAYGNMAEFTKSKHSRGQAQSCHALSVPELDIVGYRDGGTSGEILRPC